MVTNVFPLIAPKESMFLGIQRVENVQLTLTTASTEPLRHVAFRVRKTASQKVKVARQLQIVNVSTNRFRTSFTVFLILDFFSSKKNQPNEYSLIQCLKCSI